MKKILFAACAAYMLTACSESAETNLTDAAVPLSCRFTTGWDMGRSIILDNTLGSELVGITIGKDESSLGSYFGKTDRYYNLEYYATGTSVTKEGIGLYKGEQTWVYAYSPYNPDVKDITQIPIHSSAAGRNDFWADACDYLWGISTNMVDADNPTAHITMKHALSCVKVIVHRNTYMETGTVNNITISGDCFSSTATMNSLDGTVTGQSEGRATLRSSDSYVMPLPGQTPRSTHFIVIQNGKQGALDLSINVDGQVRTTTTQPVTFEQGKMYTFTLEVNEDGLTVKTILINEWGYDDDLKPTAMVNGQKVTITAEPGISVQTDRQGTTLNVTAIKYGSEASISATATGYDIKPVMFPWGGIEDRGMDIAIIKPERPVEITIR